MIFLSDNYKKGGRLFPCPLRIYFFAVYLSAGYNRYCPCVIVPAVPSQPIVPPSASTIALIGTTVLAHSGMIMGFVLLPGSIS
jgi:hypothetical protein